MAASASFLNRAQAMFAPFGEIRVRRMFGGAGVYCDELFFALLDDDAIYSKTDDETRGYFEARGLAPFQFETKNGSTITSYYGAPDEIFDDDDALRLWTTRALDAARRASKFKKRPLRRAARR